METPRARVNWSATSARSRVRREAVRPRKRRCDRQGRPLRDETATTSTRKRLRPPNETDRPRAAASETKTDDTERRRHAAAAGERGTTPSSRGRWEKIQTGFVDEPRRTVEQADELVAERHEAPRRGFDVRARAPRGPVGPRRGRLDRGPARNPAALPRILPAPAIRLGYSRFLKNLPQRLDVTVEGAAPFGRQPRAHAVAAPVELALERHVDWRSPASRVAWRARSPTARGGRGCRRTRPRVPAAASSDVIASRVLGWISSSKRAGIKKAREKAAGRRGGSGSRRTRSRSWSGDARRPHRAPPRPRPSPPRARRAHPARSAAVCGPASSRPHAQLRGAVAPADHTRGDPGVHRAEHERRHGRRPWVTQVGDHAEHDPADRDAPPVPGGKPDLVEHLLAPGGAARCRVPIGRLRGRPSPNPSAVTHFPTGKVEYPLSGWESQVSELGRTPLLLRPGCSRHLRAAE